MWACPRAQARWQQLLDYWAPLYSRGRALHDGMVKRDVFGLRLAVLPDRLWRLSELTRLGEPTAHDTVATSMALAAVWRRHVLATMYTVWRWRTEPASAAETWTEPHARARHGASLDAISHDPRWKRPPDSAATKFTAAALDSLFAGVGTLPPAPLTGHGPEDKFLLFFDGGARRNPGPGGSGAVVLRVDASDAAAEVVWSAATALGSHQQNVTNNQAEYHGLLTGLQEADRRSWTPLEVIGDSQLILRHMETYKPPRNARLVEFYAKAGRLADHLRVHRCTHHLRAHNCMADAAANVAMDAAASSQDHHSTIRTKHQHIASFLANDFGHWQVRQLA